MANHLLGYCLLQSIACLFFFVGYFQSPQQVQKASRSQNPVFNKPDWFIPQYYSIVLIADVDNLIDHTALDQAVIDHQYNNQKYTLHCGFNMHADHLLNTLLRGVNPLSLLQYGLVDFTQWDSIFHQIQKQSSKAFLFSNNNYDNQYSIDLNYITNFDTSSITNYKQSIISFVQNNDFKLLYIDKLIHDQGLKNWVVSLASDIELFNSQKNHSTIFLIVQQPKYTTVLHDASSLGALWVLSRDRIFASEVRQLIEGNYNIDSIASSLAALLDLPIPLQNHGLILPGLLYYQEKDPNKYIDYNNNSKIVEAFEFLMNYDQLYNHLSLLDKNNLLQKSQEQIIHELASGYTNLVSEEYNNTKFNEFILRIRKESTRISQWLNEEISGNLLLLGMGIMFTITSLFIYQIRAKQQNSLYNELFEIRIIDKVVIGIILFTSIFDRKDEQFIGSILTMVFILYVIKRKASMVLFIDILLKLVVVFFYLQFPTFLISYLILLYLTIYFGIMAFCFFGGICLSIFQDETLKQEILIIFCSSFLSFLTETLEVPYLSELLLVWNLIGSIWFFRSLNFAVRILLFLAINYSAVMEDMPFGLIVSILFLVLLEHTLLQLDLTITMEQKDKLIVAPISFMLYFAIILACQYNLPLSPVVYQNGPYIVQIYSALLFWAGRLTIKEVNKVFQRNLTVKQSLRKWQEAVEEFALASCEAKFEMTDPILVLGCLNLLGQVGIFMNELFHYNTSINELGSEYFYLQDALAQILLIAMLLLLEKVEGIKILTSGKRINNYSHDVSSVDIGITDEELKETKEIEL